ncbi:hypothetical protein IW261DRAFT_1443389 [Armillaria novae-zelandiae]|uniref:Dolichyldiphosphatase n=1 Tax=Armillaria novae-zelandiae TaxID=153914 RepID=A0AA39PSV3_9AGAR|nr:hypothetical protein IW261DRAFT_1443389 [Armillaria novae-zelandiae]
MWAGQFACEAFSWLIKRAVKENRPAGSVGVSCEKFIFLHVRDIFQRVGNGYGFPSSHSQYMGYFATFLICHLYFQHRFGTTGYTFFDLAWRVPVFFLVNPVSTWLQIRDGWDIWADGGREHEWLRWRKEWDSKRTQHNKKRP